MPGKKEIDWNPPNRPDCSDHLNDRIAALRRELVRRKLDALLVFNEENRCYLSGFTGEDGGINESAGMLYIGARRLLLATDSRYELQARSEAPTFERYCYRKGFAAEMDRIIEKGHPHRIGFESEAISHATAAKIESAQKKALPDCTLVPVTGIVEELRAVKTETEIAATSRALAIAEEAFIRIRERIIPGMTEKEIAWMLEKEMREAGAEALAFPVIVASGPNSALPHAVPTSREVQPGEPILVDWGARLGGYCSDTSRTFVLGDPDETFLDIFTIVHDAHLLAAEAIREGASGTAVDAVARNHIEKKGYGDRFGHSLGHGTGLAVHELPRLSPITDNPLAAGMLVTVEPGIYLPGWGGIRLENQVEVKVDGHRALNSLPLALA